MATFEVRRTSGELDHTIHIPNIIHPDGHGLVAYGACKKFETELEAKGFYNWLSALAGSGLIDIWEDKRTKTWTVTQYIITPFVLQIKPEGHPFPLCMEWSNG